MWQDGNSACSPTSPSPSFFPTADSEPSSPHPSAILPSSSLPTTFSRPTSLSAKSSLASQNFAVMAEIDQSQQTPVSDPTSPSKRRHSVRRTSSLQRVNPEAVPGTAGADTMVTGSLGRQSSLSLNMNRHSLSKKQSRQDRENGVPPSPSSTHRPQKHVMLNRRSASQDFQLRLQQQQQQQQQQVRQEEELSEASEDMMPGTPNSVSSYGSGITGMSGSERERERRQNRLSKSAIALIESRNIHTLSSNLAMATSPTDSEFGQQAAETLLSVIAQKEAKIAQLREDLETNLTELTQLKERWSQMMIEERNKQQAEVSATIQDGGNTQSMSHRLSTTSAGLWGSVVGSMSSISGVSGGISLHGLNALQQQQQQVQGSSGLASGRSSTSSHRRSESQGRSNSSRPNSPLPTYLNNMSSLNGLNTLSSPHVKKGDRTSLSSLSTCSSFSNGGDSSVFDAGHSSQSSISSAGQLDPSSTSLPKEQRDSRITKRESSGMFSPPEDVLVNTGKALVKGFGSLLDGIRTVVSDVTESESFQHSRRRTIDVVSGLAQTAADALPLPSHDDIYYHHQRLHLLDDDEDASAASAAQKAQQQQQRSRDMKSEQENGSSSDLAGTGRSRSLARRTSRQKVQAKEDRSLSKRVSQLSIRGEEAGLNGGSRADHDEEEASEWNMDDKELLESLALDAQEHGQREKIGSRLDTPVYRKVIEPPTTFASASKKYD